jgi:hypothetical protein
MCYTIKWVKLKPTKTKFLYVNFVFICVETKWMKAFTVHDVFKIARFTDAPCNIWLYISEKPETTGTYQGTIHLPRNKRPRTIQCILDIRAIFDNSSSQILKIQYR